jgi:hypothetical protein
MVVRKVKKIRSTLQGKPFYFTSKAVLLYKENAPPSGPRAGPARGLYGLLQPPLLTPARRKPLQRYGIAANPIAVAPAAQRIRGTALRQCPYPFGSAAVAAGAISSAGFAS